MQFLWVANLRFHGAALLFVAALYGLDVFVAWADVLEEPQAARRWAACRAANTSCT